MPPFQLTACFSYILCDIFIACYYISCIVLLQLQNFFKSMHTVHFILNCITIATSLHQWGKANLSHDSLNPYSSCSLVLGEQPNIW